MKKIIEGQCYNFGNNVDTDQIYPGRFLELTDPAAIGSHTMAGIEDNFPKRFVSGSIIVAGRNFGCGSSREHAPIALNNIGTSIIVAESFARIFFRNSINLGLPLMVSKDISVKCKETDKLRVDLITGEITNITTGIKLQGEPFSDYIFEILENGGIKPYLMKKAVVINNK